MDDRINNDKFSLHRFGMLLKRDWISNHSKYFMQGGILVALIAFLFFNFIWFGYYTDPGEYYYNYNNEKVSDYPAQEIAILLLPFTFIAGAISASLVGNNLSTKSSRIENFMCVGTPLEKYLCRIIIYIVGFVLLTALSVGVFELVRIIAVAIFYPKYEIEFLSVFYYKNLCESSPYLFLFVVTLFLFVQAFFTLTSIITPTYSFIKGFAFGTISSIITAMIMAPLMALTNAYDIMNPDISFYYIDAVLLIFTVVLHIISYNRYKETDLQ